MRVPLNRLLACNERPGKVRVLSFGEHHLYYSLILSVNGGRLYIPAVACTVQLSLPRMMGE
jgi:hypothetical protein